MRARYKPGIGVPQRQDGVSDDRSPFRCRNAMQASSQVQIDNARVTVTAWTFAPGAQTGHHVHAHDYVVVPMTSGVLRLVEPEGVRDASLQAGVSYARPAGVAHNVINANDYPFCFIEIELK
jgi:quercetin dioxygenase-like cupin family protein